MIFLYVVKRGKKLSFFICELILISHHNVTYNDVITTFAFPLFLSMIDTQHDAFFILLSTTFPATRIFLSHNTLSIIIFSQR